MTAIGEFQALAGALEADDLLVTVEIGHAIAGAAPSMRRRAFRAIVVRPERPMLGGAQRQLLANDALDVFESEHFRPATAAFKVGLQRLILTQR